MGGCFGPSDYERKALDGYAKRHYTRAEVERLAATGRVDVLLLHDAPTGVRFQGYGRRSDWVSEAAGLGELVARVRPRVCFFGHHHRRVDADVSGVRCIGLNLVRRPGNLVAIEMTPRGRDWSVLGEWPRATPR
jgi:Icc-related predicted phosphoesterase